MIERFAELFKKKEELKQKVETQTTILQKKAGTFKMESAIEEDDVKCSEDNTSSFVGVPAPIYLKDDPWFGPAPIKSEKQLDYMEQETLIKKQQYQENHSVESENIHEIMYQISTQNWNTVDESQGGSENFQEGPGGLQSGNRWSTFKK